MPMRAALVRPAWTAGWRRPLEAFHYSGIRFMAIAVACPTCAVGIKVPDPYAGKLFDCPNCGNRMLIPSITIPNPTGTATATARTSAAPSRQVAEKPMPSGIATIGPSGPTLELDKAAGKLLKCRACGALVGIADLTGGTNLPCPYCKAFLTVPSTHGVVKKVGRFLSLPWIVLIFVFGFLPWSEVSGNAHDGSGRLTQSGYQDLYGGAASSSHGVQEANEKASAEPDREQLSKTLQAKRLRSTGVFFTVRGPVLDSGAGLLTDRPVGAVELPKTQLLRPARGPYGCDARGPVAPRNAPGARRESSGTSGHGKRRRRRQRVKPCGSGWCSRWYA